MFCSKCGKELEDGVAFCQFCGQKQTEDSSEKTEKEAGEIATLVRPEEMEQYISPLIVSGMRAMNGYAALGSASPLIDARFTYTAYGRVYWFYKEGLMMASGDDVHIYYAGDTLMSVATREKRWMHI